MYIRLIWYTTSGRYQPRHLIWVSQTYEKWIDIKERPVRAHWATRLWVTPLPSKINVKKVENVKVCFQTQNFVWGDFKPQKWIPGQILILLDPHNLSVRPKLPYPALPKMANGKAKWHIWQCLLLAIFDLQTSYGGLKVSEFNQEFNSEVKNY